MRTFVIMAAALGAGCTGDIRAGGGGADAGATGASLRITAPASDSSHAREALDELGALVAEVALRAEAGPEVVRVAYEDADGNGLGIGTAPDFAVTARLWRDRAEVVTARGYDAGDRELAVAEVAFTVAPPPAAGCHALLDLYGLDYEVGPERAGVAEPVTVTTPINGVSYRYVANQAPRTTFFMDCTLARSLAEAAPMLRARGVVEVADIGVYNYRCIGGGTPPDCPNGVSQHAYATAIDIAGVTDADAIYYSVNDDWIINDEPTCSAATEPGKDRFLHELICELKAAGVWNIVLTPNYNAAHRDHFHVDLTPGADFLRGAGPAAVDVGPDHH
jgi:hypothetical protein